MLIAKRVSGVSVLSLAVGMAAIAVQAQELPQAPPAKQQPAGGPRITFGRSASPQDPAPSTIFGPVRRTPPPAPADFLSSPPHPETWQTARPPQASAVTAPERPVCLRTVWVDPNIDPRFVKPQFDGAAAIQRVVPPPCVQTTEPIVRP